MQGYFAVITLFLLILLVISRVMLMRRLGVKAFRFGGMDKRDFLIPPFALFFFYVVLAGPVGLPTLGREIFHNEIAGWAGAALCVLGLALFVWALVSFGRSFRVGIDEDHPGPLVTSGAFAVSRNPIYAAFGLILFGVFLVFPNWIIVPYLIAGPLLVHRQVRLEEASLKKIYGEDYLEYCKRVRRYL